MRVSTMESTGQDSSQKPQKMHFVRSMSYRVVRRVPSSRCSDSIVIASAGHTASQSLQAMQRSSPFGYRRNACSPRKRPDCGVFSSGNCTVILRAKRWRPVSIIPLTSSNNRKVRKNSRTRSIMSAPPHPQRRLHPCTEHHNPCDRHGNEHFPAQPHDLVIAIARKRGAEPDKKDEYKKYFREQPMEAACANIGPRRWKRRQPSAEKHGAAQCGDQNHIDVFGEEKHR